MSDAVAARLTPGGPAALATLGILGPDAVAVVGRLFRGGARPLVAGELRYGLFGGEGVQDDVVVDLRQAGPMAEVHVHCHGGAAVVAALLEALARHGAATVSAQEYLARQGVVGREARLRAVLAGCTTWPTAAIALAQLQPAALARWENAVAGRDRPAAEAGLAWARAGRHLAMPFRVLLAGPTNVGKSSLINALAGYRRAIVSPQAGATRDLVTARVALAGWPIELIDGAGLREAADPLELAGQSLLRQAAAAADLCVLVADGSTEAGVAEAVSLLTELSPGLVALNKADLGSAPWPADGPRHLRCAAATGAGVAELTEAIGASLVPLPPPPDAALPTDAAEEAALRSALG